MIARDETPLQYPLPTRFARVQLTGDWYACDGASFVFLGYSDSSTPLAQQDIGWGFDPAGVIAGMLLAVEDDGGSFYLPNGSQVTVWQPPDALDGHWEPIVSGELCGSGSSGESEGSESSESSGSGAPCEPVPPYMQRWPNYEMNTAQVPGHTADGCFGWISVESCGSGTGGSGGNLSTVLSVGADAGNHSITNLNTLHVNTITGQSSPVANATITAINADGTTLTLGSAGGGLQIAAAPGAFSSTCSISSPAGGFVLLGGINVLDSVSQSASVSLNTPDGSIFHVISGSTGFVLSTDPPTQSDLCYQSQTGNHYFSISDGSNNPGALFAGTYNASSLPSGTLISPPAGLSIGDVWLDTTTSAQYPILRLRAT